MNAAKWAGLVLAACLTASTAGAGVWHDDFDDGVVDMESYTTDVGTDGVITLDEGTPENPNGSIQSTANNPGGNYILTAVQVEPGDVVRTSMQVQSQWNAYSISSLGLSSLPNYRGLDNAVAGFFIQNRRNTIMAKRGQPFVFECYNGQGKRVCSHQGLEHVPVSDVQSISAGHGQLWIGAKAKLYRIVPW